MFGMKKKLGLLVGLALIVSMPTGLAKDVVLQIPLSESAAPAAPQDDFYLYVNGDWIKKAIIPPDEALTDPTEDLVILTRKQLTDITQEAVKNRASYAKESDEARVADFYACITDKKGRNAAGLGDLAKPLQEIERASSVQEYAETMASLSRTYGFSGGVLGGVDITRDRIENDRYAAEIAIPANGLGQELMTQPENAAFQKDYQDYLQQLLILYGRSKEEAAKTAGDVFALEKDIAEHSMKVGELFNPSQSTHRLNRAELRNLYQHLDEEAVLNKAGVGPANGVSFWYTSDIGAIKRVDELSTAERLPVLKAQGICALLQANAPVMTDNYAQAYADFSQKMDGAQAGKSEERRTEELNENILFETYGRLYTAHHFNEQWKAEIQSYVDKILAEYKKRLLNLDWMSEPTKQMAVKKLEHMQICIGAPDAWDEYVDKISVVRPEDGGCLVNNYLELKKMMNEVSWRRFGQPVRKDIWTDMMPQTVNAFYDQQNNSINFPAAYLQTPFYDPREDEATNMGGVGNIIAHEITHSFDSGGAQYDENGRLHNWWAPSDYAEFKKRQTKIIAFFERYVLPDGSRTNGEQTLTENIADLGATCCLTAIIGHHPEQLRHMYTRYALTWREKTTDALLHRRMVDVHALPYVRTNAILSSDNGFYEAYDVKPGDGMYVAPEERIFLW